ncbi:MAG: trimethyllysine dioxygenase [Gammaproteobacteria bacterium]
MMAVSSSNRNDVSVRKVTSTKHGLEVDFTNGAESAFFSWLWLRDHGTDAESLDRETQQRKVDTFNLPADLNARQASLELSKNQLNIEWSDDVSSSVDLNLLLSVKGYTPAPYQLVPSVSRQLWDHTRPLQQLPTVGYENVMETKDGLVAWLEQIVAYGFSIVEGVPSTDEATVLLAERLGTPQETLFGTMWHLSSDLTDHGDTAYSTQYLDPHTDGSYYHDAPGLQLFNCQQFDGKGGESVQVDGYALAELVRAEDPEAYETLYKVAVPGQYLEPGVHVRAERPVFKLSANGTVEQVTFNNYDRAPFQLPPEQEELFYRAYRLFHKHSSDQRNWLKIPLRPGMTLIFDNWRNLHGRMGYVGKRVLYGCYHSRATFESRVRTVSS